MTWKLEVSVGPAAVIEQDVWVVGHPFETNRLAGMDDSPLVAHRDFGGVEIHRVGHWVDSRLRLLRVKRGERAKERRCAVPGRFGHAHGLVGTVLHRELDAIALPDMEHRSGYRAAERPGVIANTVGNLNLLVDDVEADLVRLITRRQLGELRRKGNELADHRRAVVRLLGNLGGRHAEGRSSESESLGSSTGGTALRTAGWSPPWAREFRLRAWRESVATPSRFPGLLYRARIRRAARRSLRMARRPLRPVPRAAPARHHLGKGPRIGWCRGRASTPQFWIDLPLLVEGTIHLRILDPAAGNVAKVSPLDLLPPQRESLKQRFQSDFVQALSLFLRSMTQARSRGSAHSGGYIACRQFRHQM